MGDLIFVEAAQQYTVDLDWFKACFLRSTHTGQHRVKTIRNSSDAGEALRLDRVHAHRHPPQTGILERLRQFGEQMSVRSNSQVKRRPVQCPQASQGLRRTERSRGAKGAHHL